MLLRIFSPGNPTLFEYQCSSNQERYILASQRGDVNYHLPVTFRLRGAVDIERLTACLHDAVRTEDALNVVFTRSRSGQFYAQRKRDSVADIRCGRFQDRDALIRKTKEFVFEPENALRQRLCKFFIAEQASGEVILTISLHHSVADGVSLGLFFEKVSNLYNSDARLAERSAGRNYPAIIERRKLRNDEWSEQERAFWLASVQSSSESANMVPDRDAGFGERRAARRIVGSGEYGAAAALAAELGVTPFHVVYAAYLIALSRYCGSPVVHTTFQSSGRRGLPEAAGVIGQFSNALALSDDLSAYQSFAMFAQRLKQAVHSRIDHERFPFHEFIRETGVHPRFGINWYPHHNGLTLNGVECEEVELLEWNSDYDLNLHCLTTGGALELKLSYPAGRFAPERIEIFLEQLENLIADCVRDPSIRPDEVPLRATCDDILPSLAVPLPKRQVSEGIYDRVRRSALNFPDSDAACYGGASVSYRELMERADAFAEALASSGAAAGARLAIVATRSVDTVVAMLASLKLRAPFALLNADYPDQRLTDCISILRPDVIVFTSPQGCARPGKWRGRARAVVSVEGGIQASSRGEDAADRAGLDVQGGWPAYFLFTSGSTGAPKCVAHGEKPLLNFLDWHIDAHGFDYKKRFAMTGGLGHDPLLRDVFTPLSIGACLLIPPADFARDAKGFSSWLRENRINVLHCTPQLVSLLAAGEEAGPYRDLTHVFFGGDELDRRVVATLQRLAPACKQANFYGATETPQAATVYAIESDFADDAVPIGKGAAGAQSFIFRENFKEAGVGEIGEIVIRSDHLAIGYLNPEEGGDRFFTLSSDEASVPRRIYKTGDMGFYLPSGDIRYVGRRDRQVKIRGFRVEPGEVERALERMNEIAQAIVIPVERGEGENALAAYVIRATEEALDHDLMRERMYASFPDYMIPASFMEIDEAPLTPNGKLDTARLPQPQFGGRTETTYTPPRTAEERAIVEELYRLTGVEHIGANTRFVELGADSLSYVNASMAIEEIVGRLPAGWEHLSIRELAKSPARKSWLTKAEAPILIRAAAIAAVVAGHFKLISFTGAVGALLLVAGHSFGRFQVGALQTTGRVRSIYRLALKIAVPTMLYTTLLQIVFSTYDLSGIFLLSNFFKPEAAGGFSFWFVMVLVQNLLIFAAILSVPAIRRFTIRRPFEAGVAMLLVTYAMRCLGPFVWDTAHLFDRVPHMQLWLMALGWCVAAATTIRERILVAVLAATIIAAEFARYGGAPPILLAALVIVAAVPRVTVPALSNRLINLIAASSLFIYLTHFQARSLMEKIGIGESAWVAFLGAIAVGVVCHSVWERLIAPETLDRFRTALAYRHKSSQDI